MDIKIFHLQLPKMALKLNTTYTFNIIVRDHNIVSITINKQTLKDNKHSLKKMYHFKVLFTLS